MKEKGWLGQTEERTIWYWIDRYFSCFFFFSAFARSLSLEINGPTTFAIVDCSMCVSISLVFVPSLKFDMVMVYHRRAEADVLSHSFRHVIVIHKDTHRVYALNWKDRKNHTTNADVVLVWPKHGDEQEEEEEDRVPARVCVVSVRWKHNAYCAIYEQHK